MTVTTHAVPARWYRAWYRECRECGSRLLSDLLLTIHVRCPNGCGTMAQADQGAAPDVETVTEWRGCLPGGWQCEEHRDDKDER